MYHAYSILLSSSFSSMEVAIQYHWFFCFVNQITWAGFLFFWTDLCGFHHYPYCRKLSFDFFVFSYSFLLSSSLYNLIFMCMRLFVISFSTIHVNSAWLHAAGSHMEVWLSTLHGSYNRHPEWWFVHYVCISSLYISVFSTVKTEPKMIRNLHGSRISNYLNF